MDVEVAQPVKHITCNDEAVPSLTRSNEVDAEGVLSGVRREVLSELHVDDELLFEISSLRFNII